MKDNGSIVTHHYEGSVPFFSWPFTIQWPLFPLLLIHRGIFVSSELHATHQPAIMSRKRSCHFYNDVTKPGSGKSNKPKDRKAISEGARREERARK